MPSHGARLHKLLQETCGGTVTREECESLFIHPASRALANRVLESLEAGHLVARAREIGDSGRLGTILDALEQDESESQDSMRLQVRELERRVAVAEERLALVSHRKDRMAHLQTLTSKEQASMASYERTLQQSVVSEGEEVASMEQDCLESIAELEAAFQNLSDQLERDATAADGLFLSQLSLEPFLDSNATYADAVRTVVEDAGPEGDAGRPASEDDAPRAARRLAAQELARLQEAFACGERDRTDVAARLASHRAAHEVAGEQLEVAEARAAARNSGGAGGGALPGGLAAQGANEEVLRQQKEIADLVRQRGRLRADLEAPLVDELAAAHAPALRGACLALLEAEHARDLARHRAIEALSVREEARAAVLGAALAAEAADRGAAAAALSVALDELDALGEPDAPGAARGGTGGGNGAGGGAQGAAIRDAVADVVPGSDGGGAARAVRIAEEAAAAQRSKCAPSPPLRHRRAADAAPRGIFVRRSEALEDLLEEAAGLRARVAAGSARLLCPAVDAGRPLDTPVALRAALDDLAAARDDLDEKLRRVEQQRQARARAPSLPGIFLIPQAVSIVQKGRGSRRCATAAAGSRRPSRRILPHADPRAPAYLQAPRAPLPELFHDFFLRPEALLAREGSLE
jgi:hypothetical protein